MSHSPSSAVRRTTAGLLVLPLLALVACGEDEPADSGPGVVATTQAADPTTYCRAFYDLTEASNEDLGFSPETSTRAEIREGLIAWFGSEKAEQLMATALESAPPELAEDTQAVVDGLREYAETGDDRAVAKAIGRPRARVDRYIRQECPDVPE